MSKYFTVEGFSVLIALLEWRKEPRSYKMIYENDIEKLQELISYDKDDLDSGNYETENFKIKVIERYLNTNTSIFVYEVETK